VRDFNDFNQANNPHNEHDFLKFELCNRASFFKIDYYDVTMQFGPSWLFWRLSFSISIANGTTG
jgi:Protein of unknown function (DUF3768)